MALVTIAVAKKHLRITSDDENDDVKRKVDQASQTIVNYLKAQADPTWTPDTVPFQVQAAVLLLLGHLWGNRGDDDMEQDERLWNAIGRLLSTLRDPALA